MLALDLVLPGAMKNDPELEDVRLYTFLDLLKEPRPFWFVPKENFGERGKLCQRTILGIS